MNRIVKVGLLVLCVFLIVALPACEEREAERKSPEAEAVIKDYYKGLANQDEGALRRLQTDRSRGFVYGQLLDGLNGVELLSIKENEEEKDRYIDSGKGQQYEAENIIVLEVEAKFEYAKYAPLYYQNGVQNRVYYIVREQKNSPWLIEDMGRI